MLSRASPHIFDMCDEIKSNYCENKVWGTSYSESEIFEFNEGCRIVDPPLDIVG